MLLKMKMEDFASYADMCILKIQKTKQKAQTLFAKKKKKKLYLKLNSDTKVKPKILN